MNLTEANQMCVRADTAYYRVYQKWCDIRGDIPAGPPGHVVFNDFRDCHAHVEQRLTQIADLEKEIRAIKTAQATGSLALDLDEQERRLWEIERRHAI